GELGRLRRGGGRGLDCFPRRHYSHLTKFAGSLIRSYNRFRMRWVWVAPFAILLAGAQTPPDKPAAPPVLENSGKPMAVKFQCTEDDIQAFGLGCSEDEPCPIYLELSGIESVGAQ